MPIKNLQFEILQIISKYVHELRRMPTNYPVMTYGIYTAMLSYGARESTGKLDNKYGCVKGIPGFE